MANDRCVPEETPVADDREGDGFGYVDGVAEFEEGIFLASGTDDEGDEDIDGGALGVVCTKTCKIEKLYKNVQVAE